MNPVNRHSLHKMQKLHKSSLKQSLPLQSVGRQQFCTGQAHIVPHNITYMCTNDGAYNVHQEVGTQ